MLKDRHGERLVYRLDKPTVLAAKETNGHEQTHGTAERRADGNCGQKYTGGNLDKDGHQVDVHVE